VECSVKTAQVIMAQIKTAQVIMAQMFSKLGFGVWELEIGNFIGLGIGV